MMIPGFVTIIVIECHTYDRKKNSFIPKCHGCVFFVVKSTHLSSSTTAQNEMAIPRCRRLTSRLQGIPTLVVTKVE